jgi:hypothetical protein
MNADVIDQICVDLRASAVNQWSVKGLLGKAVVTTKCSVNEAGA